LLAAVPLFVHCCLLAAVPLFVGGSAALYAFLLVGGSAALCLRQCRFPTVLTNSISVLSLSNFSLQLSQSHFHRWQWIGLPSGRGWELHLQTLDCRVCFALVV